MRSWPRRRLDVHAVAVDARHARLGADLDADALESARGLPGQPIAERAEDLLVGFDEEHDGARGVDRAKVLLERPARELGDLPRDLATGRPAADDGEGEPPPALGFRGAVSASSNAARIRRRRLRASSIVFIGRECSASSSCPKYEVVDPDATIRLSYGNVIAVPSGRTASDRPVLEIEAA